MPLKFYNTMSRSQESFSPMEEGKVRMYTCGPTVYNYAHIGNYRAYIFEDLLRRVLKYSGMEVTQVMNLTDVDDKTIRDSQEQNQPLDEFTRKYKDAFFEDLKELHVEPAEHYPSATEHIQEMIDLVQVLVDKGIGYVGDDGSVYYSIATFKNYGKLARIDLSGQRSAVRIVADEYEKDQAADFALWKKYDESDGDVAWDSPWGKGRPGWHIECSAMSMKYLGPHFDIHTGGVDNMFPHHEDEIAQSEAANDETFVNYWLHCEHLMVNNAKMSKSLGNFFTLRDLLDRGFTGRDVRWLLMGTHYRQKLNFTFTDPDHFDGLENARTALRRIDEFVDRLSSIVEDVADDVGPALMDKADTAFRSGLEDDLNISQALAALFDLVRSANRAMDQGTLGCTGVSAILDGLGKFDTVLGVLDLQAGDNAIPPEIEELARQRSDARQAKDFARSDAIRDQLTELGWQVKDTPDGIKLSRI